MSSMSSMNGAAGRSLPPLGSWDITELIVFSRRVGSLTLVLMTGHNYLISRLRLPFCYLVSLNFWKYSFSLSFRSLTSLLFSAFNRFTFSIYFFSLSISLFRIVCWSCSFEVITFDPWVLPLFDMLLAEYPLVLELLRFWLIFIGFEVCCWLRLRACCWLMNFTGFWLVPCAEPYVILLLTRPLSCLPLVAFLGIPLWKSREVVFRWL